VDGSRLAYAVKSVEHLTQVVHIRHEAQLYQHSPHAHILRKKGLAQDVEVVAFYTKTFPVSNNRNFLLSCLIAYAPRHVVAKGATPGVLITVYDTDTTYFRS